MLRTARYSQSAGLVSWQRIFAGGSPMAAIHDPQELARLRADLDALLERDRVREREVAILRRAVLRRRPRLAAPLILAALLALVPFSILAATPFTDLTGGPHDGNI